MQSQMVRHLVELPQPNFSPETIAFLKSNIERIDEFGEAHGEVQATVVVVAYNPKPELFTENLQALERQQYGGYEIIVVDNSDLVDTTTIVRRFDLRYVKLRGNQGPQIGRNVGTMLARGRICVFLDDDAVPGEDFVKKHMEAHKEGIVAVRGRCYGRTRSQLNLLAFHYDLGPEPVPSPIDLEGNSSFDRQMLIDAGGFDMGLSVRGGYEGCDVSAKILRLTGRPGSLMYDPGPTIQHDFSTDPLKLLKKYMRHGSMEKRVFQSNPDYSLLLRTYPKRRISLLELTRRAMKQRALFALGLFILASAANRVGFRASS